MGCLFRTSCVAFSGLDGLPLQDFMAFLFRTSLFAYSGLLWLSFSWLNGLPIQDFIVCLFRTSLLAYSGLHGLPQLSAEDKIIQAGTPYDFTGFFFPHLNLQSSHFLSSYFSLLLDCLTAWDSLYLHSAWDILYLHPAWDFLYLRPAWTFCIFTQLGTPSLGLSVSLFARLGTSSLVRIPYGLEEIIGKRTFKILFDSEINFLSSEGLFMPSFIWLLWPKKSHHGWRAEILETDRQKKYLGSEHGPQGIVNSVEVT